MSLQRDHSSGCCLFQELAFQLWIITNSERDVHSTAVFWSLKQHTVESLNESVCYHRRSIEAIGLVNQIVDDSRLLHAALVHLLNAALCFYPFQNEFGYVDGEDTRGVIEGLIAGDVCIV